MKSANIRASRPARLLAVGLAAVTVVAVAWWRHAQDQDPGIELPAGEQVRLAAMVVPLMEAGVTEAKDGAREACAVKILGTEPADAVTAQAVTTAYVWSLCQSLGTPVLNESQHAAVVHLGTPTGVEVPTSPPCPPTFSACSRNGYRTSPARARTATT
jgi:hypothetical protein